jgi:hypothetical protein
MKSLVDVDVTDWISIMSYLLTRNYICDRPSRENLVTIHCYWLLIVVYFLIVYCTHSLHSSWVERTVIVHDKMAAKRASRQYRACRRPTGHKDKWVKQPTFLEWVGNSKLTLTNWNKLFNKIQSYATFPYQSSCIIFHYDMFRKFMFPSSGHYFIYIRKTT